MPRKTTRLFVRGFKSIGIVDAPACEGSEIVIAKRRDAAPQEEPMSQKKTDTPATPTVEELSAQVTDLTAKLAAKDAELVTAKAAATPPPSAEEVLKALDGPARELVLKAQADAAAATLKADEAQKTANTERELRQAGEYVSKAKAYEPVAGKATDFGPVLQRIEGNCGTADDFKRLGEVLSGAAEIARKSKLFTEVGKSGHGAGGDAREQVVAKAAEIRTARPELTEQQAFIAALDADPTLAKRYRDEREQTAH